MLSLQYHQVTAQKFPYILVESTNTEDPQYETFNIGGIQGGLELTHMIK